MSAKKQPPKYPRYTGISAADAAYLNDLIDQGRLVFLKDAKTVEATVWVQGRDRSDGEIEVSFTIVRLKVVDSKGRKYELVGAAKRNCNDDAPDDERGRRIALARAARGEAVTT